MASDLLEQELSEPRQERGLAYIERHELSASERTGWAELRALLLREGSLSIVEQHLALYDLLTHWSPDEGAEQWQLALSYAMSHWQVTEESLQMFGQLEKMLEDGEPWTTGEQRDVLRGFLEDWPGPVPYKDEAVEFALSTWGARPEDMREAQPMPEQHAILPYHKRLNAEQYLCVRLGFRPLSMDDRWLIYEVDDVLYFHRSWTGFCVYEVHFAHDDGGYVSTELRVNRNEEQYSSSNDHNDLLLVDWLLSSFLLGEDTPFPALSF